MFVLFFLPYTVPGCISARYALALFSLLGFVNVYAMRVNLSVALVPMVNHTETNHSVTACPATNTTAAPKVLAVTIL